MELFPNLSANVFFFLRGLMMSNKRHNVCFESSAYFFPCPFHAINSDPALQIAQVCISLLYDLGSGQER